MLVLDRRLQHTHNRATLTAPLKIYDIGSDDCRTYVDKILIGTGQAPTKIGRFSHKDSFFGRRIVAPLIRFVSKTREDELHGLLAYHDEGTPDITHHIYAKGKAVPF